MKLLDTLLVVYARTPASPFHAWAVQQISEAVSTEGDGVALNVVSLAELCSQPKMLPVRPVKVRRW